MNLFIDNFTNIDFSYLDEQRGMVGETWLASIEVQGELDSQGMVVDFGTIKQCARTLVDTQLDHCLLVPQLSPCLTIKSDGDPRSIVWRGQTGEIHCTSPRAAITFIPTQAITPDSIAKWCVQQLTLQIPAKLNALNFELHSEEIDEPYYQYTHGLKKHHGKCQRIAHGHRSKIFIWRDGKLSRLDMQRWSDQLKDIYIANSEDLIDSDSNSSLYHFGYTARSGEFSLAIAKQSCYLIHSDTTVELIAQHIATTLAKENPTRHFKVKAYEGKDKGAVAFATMQD